MLKLRVLTLSLLVALLSACGGDKSSTSDNQTQSKNVSLPIIANSALGSVVMSNTVPEQFKVDGIETYVKITPKSNSVTRSSRNASNAAAIHIIATDDGVSNEKVRRAVSILQHFLTNKAGSQYGADKSSMAESMASRNATLILTADDDQNQLVSTRLYAKEAARQGKLETWINASSASTLAGLNFDSADAFVESLLEYADKQSEADFEAVVEGLIGGIVTSTQTSQWLLNSQSLMYRELSLEGDCHYMSNYASYCPDLGTHADRDAAFEEILHITQAQGIAPNTQNGFQTLQQQIDVRALAIYDDHKLGNPAVWQPTPTSWDDWKDDDFNPDIGTSYSHEYFAAAFEAYMGVAKHNGHGLDGYQALTRTAMASQDAEAKQWIEALFHEYLQYTARIDSAGVVTYFDNTYPSASVTPTFLMNRDDAQSQDGYTYKSQWLLNVEIIGDKAIDLSANDEDNVIKGNSANNKIFGKGGIDTYLIDNKYAECTLTTTKYGAIVDCPSSGTDELVHIEKITFSDKTITL
ncbi:hypothetical protein EJ063_02190 [Vibrio aquaticus]|uniref:Lipoprotein n=1 Tax=Vibrio aquaticus TaxID=2496559 RepID=A0A3S0N7E4_9VIBR|nr:hypothetical protein [Vibrio aquaticus]RTZ17618.1 hypothetical protein EJ063_02190 [Vibrio aquaticus]